MTDKPETTTGLPIEMERYRKNGQTYILWGTVTGKIGGICSLAAFRRAIRDGYHV